MPPTGGYRPITFDRIPVKKLFNGYAMIAGFVAMTTGSFILYKINFNRVRRDQVEVNDAKLALRPFILAERDREYLKQLRINRDEEAELMKNVPGWKVGTLYGEPIYKTLPKEEWYDVTGDEYYVHAHPAEQDKKKLLSLWF